MSQVFINLIGRCRLGLLVNQTLLYNLFYVIVFLIDDLLLIVMVNDVI